MKLSKSIILLSIFSFNMFFLLGSEQKISSDQFLQNELQEIRNLIEQSKIKNDRTKSNLESLRSRLEKFNDILNRNQRGKENIKQKDSSLIKKQSVITQNSDSNSPKITNTNDHNRTSVPTIQTPAISDNIAVEKSQKVPMETHHSRNFEARLGYGPTFPLDSKINSYDLEFSTGHFIDLSLIKTHQIFFWGGHIGLKSHKTDKVSSVPILGSVDAGGNNTLINLAACTGFRYFFNEHFFSEGQLSTGLAFAKNQISIGSTSLKSNDTEFFWGLGTGIGFAFNEHFSLMLKYQFDGHTKSAPIGEKLFNQVFLQFGTNF